MKIAGRAVAGVLRDSTAYAGLLMYGEDVGLVRERAALAARVVVGGTGDVFRSTVLLREEHARLREEVMSRSLAVGRRVIRVQDATDGLAAVLAPMKHDRVDALVILEAAALPPRSKLRLMAESLPDWAAIACYPETGIALSGHIRQVLAASSVTVQPDALEFLAEELAIDSTRRSSELEKLALYVGAQGEVNRDAAILCCASQVDASLNGAVSAALTGDVAACDRLLQELERDGATGQGLLAVLAMQLYRLIKVRALIAEGHTPEEACRRLIPPVYPRQLPSFLQEVQRWSASALRQLGASVRDADIACKRAGSRDFAIASRLLALVATRAHHPRQAPVAI